MTPSVLPDGFWTSKIGGNLIEQDPGNMVDGAPIQSFNDAEIFHIPTSFLKIFRTHL